MRQNACFDLCCIFLCVKILQKHYNISNVSFVPEHLGLTEPEYYYYLNQGGTYTVDGTDDKKDFNETMVLSSC